MKLKKGIAALVFVLALAGAGIMMKSYFKPEGFKLYPLNHPPIEISEGEKVLFYHGGFAVTGESIKFYDNGAKAVSCPFEFGTENIQSLSFTDLTENFILIDGDLIYRINDKVLNLAYTLNSPAIGIKEYGRYILLLMEDDRGNLILKYLDVENEAMFDFGFQEDFFYLDIDSNPENSFLTVLTLDVSGALPTSKVLHYNNNLTLAGIISTVDQVFYKAFKLPLHTLLIGNNRLVCYNRENQTEWEIETWHLEGAQWTKNELGVLVYLGHTIKDDTSQESFNGVFIDNSGKKHNINLPQRLTGISPYKDMFLGIQGGRKITIINKAGDIEGQYTAAKNIDKATWSPFHLNSFFIFDKDNMLQIYTLEQEE